MIETIMDGLNEENYVGVVYIDLQKVFDSIDHRCLLQKLFMYGVTGPSLDWFSSYLLNRRQRVFVNGKQSGYGAITHGVPQGSCLGPLLFLTHM